MGGWMAVSAQGYYPNDRYSNQSADLYYYYPDDNVYYYPYTNNYIYYDQNRWCSSPNLPGYLRFNRAGLRVNINYRGNSVWSLNNDHMSQYRSHNNGYYNDNRYRRDNHFGNSGHGRNDRYNNQRNDHGRNWDRHGNGRRNGRH